MREQSEKANDHGLIMKMIINQWRQYTLPSILKITKLCNTLAEYVVAVSIVNLWQFIYIFKVYSSSSTTSESSDMATSIDSDDDDETEYNEKAFQSKNRCQ